MARTQDTGKELLEAVLGYGEIMHTLQTAKIAAHTYPAGSPIRVLAGQEVHQISCLRDKAVVRLCKAAEAWS